MSDAIGAVMIYFSACFCIILVKALFTKPDPEKSSMVFVNKNNEWDEKTVLNPIDNTSV